MRHGVTLTVAVLVSAIVSTLLIRASNKAAAGGSLAGLFGK